MIPTPDSIPRRVWQWVVCHTCTHEWIKCRHGARLYLRCLNCLTETPGLEAAVWIQPQEPHDADTWH